MKKYFALIITAVLVLTCFTACKPKLQNGALVTNAAGENYAAVTKAGGGIARDEAGNLIVLVTDENGKNIKGENGEFQTNPVALEHALVIGNTIEMPDFSIQIPNGWSDQLSFADLIIKKNNSTDTVKISVIENSSLSKVIEEHTSTITQAKAMFPDTVTENKGISFGQIEDAQFYSAYVPDAGNGQGVYMAYVFFERAGRVYSCHINSQDDLREKTDEFTDILATINFVR